MPITGGNGTIQGSNGGIPGTSYTEDVEGNKHVVIDGSLQLLGPLLDPNLAPLGALLPNTRNALMRASVGGGALRASVLGDSTVVAFGAVTGAQDINGNAQRSIGRHLLTWLPRVFGAGARRDSFFGSGSILYSDATKAQYDTRVTQSGTGISYDSLRSIGDGAIKLSAVNDTLTFAPENDFTEVRIRSLGGVGGWGAVQVRVNSVLVGTISASVGSGYNLTTYTGTWAAGDAIEIKNVAQGNNLFDLFSIECVDSAFRGISILEMGWSGCTIADLVSSNYVWQHLPALVAQAPDLVILKCTTNDSGSPAQSNIATPVSAYKASLKALQDALPNTDIVFADCFPSAYADLNPGALDGYKQAAIDLGMPVIDLRDIYGNTSASALETGLAIGPVHPGEVAYALYARVVSERVKTACGGLMLGPSGTEVYNSYIDLPMFGNNIGDVLKVARLSGTNTSSIGHFLVEWTGTRWSVVLGQSVVSDSSELIYTSVGTSYVGIKSVIIPGGLIGDTELWECSSQVSLVSGTVDAGAAHRIKLGGSDLWQNLGAMPSLPYCYDLYPKRFRRAGATFRRYTSSLSDGAAIDEVSSSVDLSQNRQFEVGVTPSAIGNSYRFRRILLTRAG